MSDVPSAPVSAPTSASPSPSSGNVPWSPSSAVPTSKATAPATTSQTSSQPSEQPSETFEVKVNGRTVKMSRQEVLDHASMSHAANDKFNEAKKLRGEYDKSQERIKKDFIEYLSDPALGLSKDQIRARFEDWYAKEFIEPESLTQDQKRIREYEAKLKKYEEDEKQTKERTEQEEQAKLTTQQRDYLQNQIVEAMESSGLPKTKFFASRMAFYMRQNLVNGWEAPLPMIVQQVKAERQSMMSDLVQGASVEQLTELFGIDGINKIRQYDLKQLREKRNLPPAQVTTTPAGESPYKTGAKIYSSDVNKRLRKMMSEG